MKKEHIKITPFFEIMKISGETKFSSVQSVMSDSLRPRGLQHARLPCPSPTPRACSNSCPSSRWYHPLVLGETKNNLLKTDLGVEIQQWQTNAIILQRQRKLVAWRVGYASVCMCVYVGVCVCIFFNQTGWLTQEQLFFPVSFINASFYSMFQCQHSPGICPFLFTLTGNTLITGPYSYHVYLMLVAPCIYAM